MATSSARALVCDDRPHVLRTSVAHSRSRDGKESLLQGFGSVRVLHSAENLGSVLYEFGCLTVLNVTVPQ